MDYEKKYKGAINRAKAMVKVANSQEEMYNSVITIFPELKEFEDEKIRKELITHCRNTRCVTEETAERIAKWIDWLEKQDKKNFVTTDEDEKIREQIVYAINKLNVPESEKNKLIAWLEKQGEHANFLSKIQVGDKVTRNEAGVLVNLSQLRRVAKPRKKQGEQKPAEWSEKDESLRLKTIGALETCKIGSPTKCVDEQINWLKSLKERYTWNPSDEQMEALLYETEAWDEDSINGQNLTSLFNDLKKLKGE